MSPMRLSLLALALAASAASAQDVVGRKDRVYTASERVSEGGTVRIYSTIGDIAITEGKGGSVEFRAEKDTERGDIEDIGFVIHRDRDGITICAVMSADDECDTDGVHRASGWRDSGRRWRERARVTITVQVPKGTRLKAGSGNGRVSVAAAVISAHASSGNGRVDVSGVLGPVQASSGNGDVTVETTNGPVNASSGNGRIRVSMDKLTGNDDISLSTGNGRIELVAPRDFSAEVDANTGNGFVTTDFPIQLIGRLTPNRMRGTIGNGTRRLHLSSGNGTIEIRKKGA